MKSYSNCVFQLQKITNFYFMKNFFFCSLLLPFVVFTQNQHATDGKFCRKNSIQAEAFGHGLFYSLNYERIVLNHNKFKTAVQIGASYYTPKSGIMALWLPVTVNGIFAVGKRQNHHVELGFGQLFSFDSFRLSENNGGIDYGEYFVAGRLGYRFQKPTGRILIRAAFTPVMNYDGEFHPLGGLAFGYNF
jgi:hypothetical protein